MGWNQGNINTEGVTSKIHRDEELEVNRIGTEEFGEGYVFSGLFNKN